MEVKFMEAKKFFSAKNIAYTAVLLALVVVLQIWGGFIRISDTSLSFVLVPIVLGALLLGIGGGALLGLSFGIITLVQGILVDPFTSTLFSASPVMTVLICLVKGTAAGVIPAVLYRLIKNKNQIVAVFIAAASAPIANTGIFILGCLMISGAIGANFTATGAMSEVVYFLFILCAGTNFLVEFAINLVLAPVIYRVVVITEKYILKKHAGKGKAEPAQPAAQSTEQDQ